MDERTFLSQAHAGGDGENCTERLHSQNFEVQEVWNHKARKDRLDLGNA